MDRLSPACASLLHADDGVQHLHVGTVAVLEGPPPTYDELLNRLAGVLPLVPRYRQRVMAVPFQAGRPVWADDTGFQLRYHLRHSALPDPGSGEQLGNLVGRVMSNRLDRRRPLWELWMVENVGDDRWALVTKTHQSMLDGVGATPLQSVLLSATPETRAPVPDRWAPAPEPSGLRLWTEAVTDIAIDPAEMVRVARSTLRLQRAAIGWAVEQGRRFVARPDDTSWGSPSLHGPIGRDRRWVFADLDFDTIRAVRTDFDVTTNDVIVAAVTSGFRALLLQRGEMHDDTPLGVLFPVSVAGLGQRYENEIEVLVADLPVTDADPVSRLRRISAEMRMKMGADSVAGDVLTSLRGFAPPVLLALGSRMVTAAARYQAAGFQSVVTNVPGPQEPRWLLGRRLVQSYPVMPLLQGVHVAVGAFSYDGRVAIGVTGNYDSSSDLEVMVRGMTQGLEDLAHAPDTVTG